MQRVCSTPSVIPSYLFCVSLGVGRGHRRRWQADPAFPYRILANADEYGFVTLSLGFIWKGLPPNLVSAENIVMSDTIIISAVYIAIGPF